MRRKPVVNAGPRSVSLPSMVVTPDQNVAFVIEQRGIAALEVATGAQIWGTSAAVRPVGRVGNALVALDASGNVVVLDAATGAPHEKCPRLDMRLALRDSHGRYASSDWTARSEPDAVRVEWTSSYNSWKKGVAPSEEEEDAAKSSATGAYEIDVDRCETRTVAAQVKSLDHPVMGARTPSEIDVRVGFDSRYIVYRSRGSEKLPAIDLRTDDHSTRWRFSEDARHILTGWWSAGRTTVFDLESGAKVGSVYISNPVYAFVVVGHVLLFDGSAWDLRVAEKIWSREAARSIDTDDGKEPPK
ncbi:MAG: hypothetical protein SFX73_28135 [Kofleriaceae bacterium]|nr:hypothetical protein [Kofleriaceae bacterium]